MSNSPLLAMALLLLVIATLAAVVWRAYRSAKRQYPYPPGPPADPIIGHARKMPSDNVEETFHEWAQVYGASPTQKKMFS
jgi:hypothetical protein